MSEKKRILKIVVNRGEEFQIRQGCVYEQDGFFYSAYQQGARIMRDLFAADWEDPFGINCRAQSEQADYDFRNNIIAFCADRGGGKSSAMRTFAHALAHLHEEKQHHSKEEVQMFWGENIVCKYFAVLPVIDPTLMQKQDAFMRIILSRMFAQLRKKWDEEDLCGRSEYYSERVSENEQTHILRCFRRCYRSLDAMYKAPSQGDTYDDLEEMAALGDSANFKAEFRNLLQLYLKQILPGRKNACLVIQIDDADLNIEKAHDILDDVSKYCILPETLVLMAMNMEQTQYVMEQYYISQFEKMISTADKRNDPFICKKCRDMAARYIDKAIPSNHQIHLPNINKALHDPAAEMTVEYIGRKSENAVGEDLLRQPGDDFIGYQERLLRLFYQKTGIMLIKPANYRHNLLPGFMRELTHFLLYLNELESVDIDWHPARLHAVLANREEHDAGEIAKAQNELTKRKQNLEAVEQYFFNNWCELNLNRADRQVIEELANAVHSTAAQITQSYIKSAAGRLGENIEEEKTTVTNLPPANGSYARMMCDLQKLVRRAYQEEDYHMLYALRFYYTLTLHRVRLALLEERGQWTQIVGLVKLDIWVPNYSRLSRGFAYGRFAVEPKALYALENDGTNLAEKYRGLLYAVSQNGDPYVFDDDPDGQLETTAAEDVVVFDMNYMVLTMLCTYEGLYTKGEDPETDLTERLNWAEAVFQALLNWDVQHYFENRIYSSTEKIWANDNSIPTIDTWIGRYYNRLFDELKKVKYIPYPWPKTVDDNYLTKILRVTPQNLPCANLTFLTQVIRLLKDEKSISERKQSAINLLRPWRKLKPVENFLKKLEASGNTLSEIILNLEKRLAEIQEELKGKAGSEKEALEKEEKQIRSELARIQQKTSETTGIQADAVTTAEAGNALRAIFGSKAAPHFVSWPDEEGEAFRSLNKNWNGRTRRAKTRSTKAPNNKTKDAAATTAPPETDK